MDAMLTRVSLWGFFCFLFFSCIEEVLYFLEFPSLLASKLVLTSRGKM